MTPINTSEGIRMAAVGRMIVPMLALSIAGCSFGDSLTNPPDNSGKGTIPWALNLNHGAINVAVGESVQLSVSPVDADGKPLTGLPEVEYTTSDTAVKVNAQGVLVGSAPKANVLLVARMHSLEGNWTIADSARVAVVETPYEARGLRMIPDGPELVPANHVRRFTAFATDAGGNALLTVEGDTIYPIAHYAASTPRREYYVANNWSGIGYARNISEPTITATAYMFGEAYEDQVKFRVTWPDSAVLSIHRVSTTLNPSPSHMSQTDITVLQGGKVMFRSLNPTQEDDIVFDDLASVVDGNIPVVPANPGHAVIFPNVGKFTYKSSRGWTGTVTVVAP